MDQEASAVLPDNSRSFIKRRGNGSVTRQMKYAVTQINGRCSIDCTSLTLPWLLCLIEKHVIFLLLTIPSLMKSILRGFLYFLPDLSSSHSPVHCRHFTQSSALQTDITLTIKQKNYSGAKLSQIKPCWSIHRNTFIGCISIDRILFWEESFGIQSPTPLNTIPSFG